MSSEVEILVQETGVGNVGIPRSPNCTTRGKGVANKGTPSSLPYVSASSADNEGGPYQQLKKQQYYTGEKATIVPSPSTVTLSLSSHEEEDADQPRPDPSSRRGNPKSRGAVRRSLGHEGDSKSPDGSTSHVLHQSRFERRITRGQKESASAKGHVAPIDGKLDDRAPSKSNAGASTASTMAKGPGSKRQRNA